MDRTIGIALETLTIVFVVLKLAGLITWSWWIVLAPTWIPLFLGIVLLTWLLLFLRK